MTVGATRAVAGLPGGPLEPVWGFAFPARCPCRYFFDWEPLRCSTEGSAAVWACQGSPMISPSPPVSGGLEPGEGGCRDWSVTMAYAPPRYAQDRSSIPITASNGVQGIYVGEGNFYSAELMTHHVGRGVILAEDRCFNALRAGHMLPLAEGIRSGAWSTPWKRFRGLPPVEGNRANVRWTRSLVELQRGEWEAPDAEGRVRRSSRRLSWQRPEETHMNGRGEVALPARRIDAGIFSILTRGRLIQGVGRVGLHGGHALREGGDGVGEFRHVVHEQGLVCLGSLLRVLREEEQ